MGWTIVLVGLVSALGAMLGAAVALAWVGAWSTGARTPLRPPAPAPTARPLPPRPTASVAPRSLAGPAPAWTAPAWTAPVGPARAAGDQPERTVPLELLPAPTPTRVLPALGYAVVPPTPPAAPPLPHRPTGAVPPPPGAVRPPRRGRGPALAAVDELAVHYPGGGVQRIGSGVLVGRATGCRVRFRLSQVSRRHAVIYRARGAWWIGDLGSTNGTTVDGVPVVGAAELRVGSHVRVGGEDGVGFTVRPPHAPTGSGGRHHQAEVNDLESSSAA